MLDKQLVSVVSRGRQESVQTVGGLGMNPNHTVVRLPISLAFPWHKSIAQMADVKHTCIYVTGKFSKSEKAQNPLNPGRLGTSSWQWATTSILCRHIYLPQPDSDAVP